MYYHYKIDEFKHLYIFIIIYFQLKIYSTDRRSE